MLKHKDHLSSLNKARKERNQRLNPRYLVLLLAVIAVVGIIMLGVKSAKKPASGKAAEPAPAGQVGSATPAQADLAGVSPEEEAAQKEAQETDNVISPYNNLGTMQVSGYLNIRETPSIDGKIIGKLSGNGVYEILATGGGWSHITSGGMEGYIGNQYLLTGDEAGEEAKELVKLRVAVTANNLDIRQAPALDPGNVTGQALKGEHYVVKGLEDDWIQIGEGYIPSEYVEVAYSLNGGCKMDMKAMAINQYDNPVISEVNNYLNVRQESKSDGKIVGKMISKAAGKILEALDGRYKIKSGPIIGYVLVDPQYMATGQEARDIVMQNATLKVVIDTDMLDVCTGPNTEAETWAQIVKDKRYPVVAQLDGQMEINLDSVDEEGGSKMDKAFTSTRGNNVEVCCTLSEAIKFSPAEVVANNVASRRSKVVNYVLQFVGNPCAWDGTSLTKGVDCSEFTIQVVKRFGTPLPHHSGPQIKMDKAVTSGNMRPGDLIFCAGSGRQVNHVAIYIGNGQAVHAASRKGGIKISAQSYRSPVAIRNTLGD